MKKEEKMQTYKVLSSKKTMHLEEYMNKANEEGYELVGPITYADGMFIATMKYVNIEQAAQVMGQMMAGLNPQ